MPVTKKKPSGGRPQTVIDKDLFEDYCRMMCTEEEIAHLCRCSIETLNKWCNKEYGKNFKDVRDEFQAYGKMKVRRYQFQQAQCNVVMSIFWGKNHLGQSDDPLKYAKETTIEDKLDNYLGLVATALNAQSGGGDDEEKSNDTETKSR